MRKQHIFKNYALKFGRETKMKTKFVWRWSHNSWTSHIHRTCRLLIKECVDFNFLDACDVIWFNMISARNGMSLYMTSRWPEYCPFLVNMTAPSRLGVYSTYYTKRDGRSYLRFSDLTPSPHFGTVISGHIWPEYDRNMTVMSRHMLGTIGAPITAFLKRILRGAGF